AFTIAASMEVGGRRAGGTGVLGWIRKLPWRNPSFTAQVLAMFSFIFGGAGGIINASFTLDLLVHNTTWIPGHFHLTVGTATTLTFFGMTFWWVPHLTKRAPYSSRLALWSAWTWFVGMMLFGLGMHWQGLYAVPRRAHISNLPEQLQGIYADAAVPQFLTAVSGIILLAAVIMYFTVLFGTLFGKRLEDADVPAIPFSEAREIRASGVVQMMDRLGAWFVLAAFLVALAYLPTLISMFTNQIALPGLRLW